MTSPLRTALAPLHDARTLAHGLVSTGLTVGLTLIDPRELTVGQRFLYRSANAALSAWMVRASFLAEDPRMPDAVRRGITVGAAGAVLGSMELHEAMDARLVRLLERLGVERPRGTLAITSGALCLGTWYLARRSLES